MKNPHEVEPTRYMNRKETYAIDCNPNYGPCFNWDISIRNNCNNKDSCLNYIEGTQAYECHPQYKGSLYVNTAGADEFNRFTVSDYEVYAH